MIECDECGKRFEPLTDAYKCPVCGTENYPDAEWEYLDPPKPQPEREHWHPDDIRGTP